MDNKQRKNLFIGIAIFILFIFCIIIISIINLTYSAKLTTTIAPSFAKITINNKQYKSNQELSLKPSEEVDIIISADGFETQIIPISLTKGETTNITTYLIPNDGDMSWYYNNPEENNLLLTIGGIQAAESAKKYAQEYPISTVLPIISVDSNPQTDDWKEYRIDGGKLEECQKNVDFCVVITDSTGGNYDSAIKTIQEKGFNPDDYEIIYKYTPITPINQATLDKMFQEYGVNF